MPRSRSLSAFLPRFLSLRRLAPAAALLTAAGLAHGAPYDLERLGVPRFVDVNYIDLAKVSRLSKFRSGMGHDYSDNVERCRSMKHYFMFPDASTAIVSPVSGTVTRVYPEWAGWQVQVTSADQPQFTFILFHVTLARPLAEGEPVVAGQPLGTHVGTQTASDIAVRVDSTQGFRLVSYFDTLTDAAFAAYQARGITSRETLVTSRAQRDAAPLQCSGEAFVDPPADALEHVLLRGTTPPSVQPLVHGPLQAQTLGLRLVLPPDVAGQPGRLFVAAALPAAAGGGLYLLSPAGWLPFKGCEDAASAAGGPLPASAELVLIGMPADLSALAGTVVHAGYGLGGSDAAACAGMLQAGSHVAAYIVR